MAASKVKSIKFSYQELELKGNEYRCEQITDSVDFLPGKHYDKKTVDSLCHSREWKVTIVDARD